MFHTEVVYRQSFILLSPSGRAQDPTPGLRVGRFYVNRLILNCYVSCTFVRELGDNLETMLIGQAASWQCKVSRTSHTTKQSK